MRAAYLAVVAALPGILQPALADAPPEPEGYRLENYRAPTPATLTGAKVIDTSEAKSLWQQQAAIFVDVLPQPPRPANLPPDTLWRVPPRNSIPGAIWLPNVGFGEIAAETSAYFQHGLDTATGGDRTRPLVFFCERNCWMSWNAAKRAMTYGYSAVSWYPEGTEGWKEADLPLEKVEKAP
ncbi:PQQ-dependent catabolism-associated CXXCW motif protein [Microvirga massiliensis]|uniref:PQQ-dependent catabolism-associated CXXCW motif protein n=1 Tax=Microvirga massiliensis TaxID=1033741 RepID=UPI00062BD962|nr:PQQ-dependent catabolism-associated CXXCW motif protein [Microvirga massiliensis]